MTILYRLHEVLHRLLKKEAKRQQKYTAILKKRKEKKNESKIWGSEDLVSFTLLGGVSVAGLIIPFVIILKVFLILIILIFIWGPKKYA